ncbi:hypothetical protein [Kitasatospora sp. NPDC093102]|uniref:hypothetical protein n=1 Tax=Kitasatospora sp. NPDC093102 TaxID=3155069 RepID=UPI00344A2D7F
MSESAQPAQPVPSDEDLAKLVTPSILELQRLIVERTRRALPDGGGGDVISVTSCNNNSC